MEFVYHGTDRKGLPVTGRMGSPNEGKLRMSLRKQGIRPTLVSPVSAIGERAETTLVSGFLRQAPATDLAKFFTQAFELTKRGLSTAQAVRTLEDHHYSYPIRKQLPYLRTHLNQGLSLSRALRSAPKAFPPYSGLALEQGLGLSRLKTHFERLAKVEQALLNNLLALASAVLVGVVTTVNLFAFVYSPFRAWLGGNLFLVSLIAIFMLYLWALFVTAPEGRALMSRWTWTFPRFRSVLQAAGWIQIVEILSLYKESNLSLSNGLEQTRFNSVIPNWDFWIKRLRGDMARGKSLTEALRRSRLFSEEALALLNGNDFNGIWEFYSPELEALTKSYLRNVGLGCALVLLVSAGLWVFQ